jgi:hypothetical protein
MMTMTNQPRDLPLRGGVVTLGDLCSRYRRDPARARAQLRKANLRPRTGLWSWVRSDPELSLVIKTLLSR